MEEAVALVVAERVLLPDWAQATNLVAQILESILRPPSENLDCLSASELAHHIVSLHHGYLKEALPVASRLLQQGAAARSGRYPEIPLAAQMFDAYCLALHDSMRRQEEWLLPLVCGMQRRPATHRLMKQVAMIEPSHVRASTILAGVRKIMDPIRHCPDCQPIWESLTDFEEESQMRLQSERLLISHLFPTRLGVL